MNVLAQDDCFVVENLPLRGHFKPFQGLFITNHSIRDPASGLKHANE